MKYKEIFRLKEMLEKADIQFSFAERFDGYRIRYPEHGICVCSVIEFDGSYGSSEDKLEIMGLLTRKEEKDGSVLGHLSAEEVFKRIKRDYLWKRIRNYFKNILDNVLN